MMKKAALTSMAMLALVGALVTTAAAQTSTSQRRPLRREKQEHHPMIERAIRALEGAKDDLEDASRDFCGHREDAAESVTNALNQLRLALASDRAQIEPHRATESGNIPKGKGQQVGYSRRGAERHPKIRQAIRALERAKDDLEDAAHDFHGHRAEALEASNRALDRLKMALACDKK